MSGLPPSDSHAGVLRRAAAFAFDVLVVSVVLSIVGSTAFALTDGRVQTHGFLPLFDRCDEDAPTPAEIDPSQEFGPRVAVCAGGALPFVVSARWLVAGRTTHSGAMTTLSFRDYPVSTSDIPIEATDLTEVSWIVAFTYALIFLAAYGRTIGMRLMNIRLSIGDKTPMRRGVPIPRLLLRTCIAIGGLALPALSFDRAFGIHDPTLAYTALFVGILGPIAWIAINVSLIASGRDPVYDRLAGLKVSVARS